MTPPDVYDHLAPTDDEYPPGTYRVVGTGEEVTLLRVADGDGRRRSTGRLLAVAADELDAFERAPNPDGNRSLRAAVGSGLTAAYWSTRTFARHLATRPVPAGAALALIAAGAVGGRTQAVPDSAGGVAILLGALALAYVGSGRPRG